MANWTVQDAEAGFHELLDTCLRDGPQVITRSGRGIAVLVPLKDWRRLRESVRPTLKDLLLESSARADLVLPERGRLCRRPPRLID